MIAVTDLKLKKVFSVQGYGGDSSMKETSEGSYFGKSFVSTLAGI